MTFQVDYTKKKYENNLLATVAVCEEQTRFYAAINSKYLLQTKLHKMMIYECLPNCPL